MPLSELIQRFIHMLEVGAGSRYLRLFIIILCVVALGFLYNLRGYRNLAAPEAMDASQLARNLAEGEGYTTKFIRPFSLYLVQKHNTPKTPVAATSGPPDFARIKSAHPDLANAPVYPVVLAGLMKILPFHYPVNLNGTFWANGGIFQRYQPDFLIALFNELLLLVVILQTFFLAKKLFDINVAWFSALLVLGCDLLWRFSTAGLPTMLLMVIFLGLVRVLLAIESGARQEKPRNGRLLLLALTAGIVTGIGGLTLYSFGWMIIPVAFFLALFSGPKRVVNLCVALAAFALVLTPWIIRNETVSGTAFGTAGYAIMEGTFVFPQFQVERSLHPQLSQAMWLKPYVVKLFENLRGILTDDLLKSGATWAGALFLAGLFLGFRNPGNRRMRYFLLMCLGLFVVVQSLGRTQLSVQSPEVNSENLLVLLVPLVFIFGASFFFTLVEQMTLPLPQLRYVVIGGFAGLCCLPLVFTLVNKNVPVVYPPYYPPNIQKVSNWMKPEELMMSDVPWAVAWYGNRQCVWLTLDNQSEFFAINDYLKTVQALYLTPQSMDAKFVSDWVQAKDKSWGNFIVEAVLRNQFSPGFPLRFAPSGFLPDWLFLTDRDRWTKAQ